MDKKLHDLHFRLRVYRDRLSQAEMLYHMGQDCLHDVCLYEMLIDDVEADIFVEEIKESLNQVPVKPWRVQTDCMKTVIEVMRDNRVVLVKNVWSWRSFKFLWHIEFYLK